VCARGPGQGCGYGAPAAGEGPGVGGQHSEYDVVEVVEVGDQAGTAGGAQRDPGLAGGFQAGDGFDVIPPLLAPAGRSVGGGDFAGDEVMMLFSTQGTRVRMSTPSLGLRPTARPRHRRAHRPGLPRPLARQPSRAMTVRPRGRPRLARTCTRRHTRPTDVRADKHPTRKGDLLDPPPAAAPRRRHNPTESETTQHHSPRQPTPRDQPQPTRPSTPTDLPQSSPREQSSQKGTTS
jgi:hypothetical protein